MSKQDQYEVDGVVDRVRGNNNYDVLLSSPNGQERLVKCHLSGKMRQYKIKVLVGDEVKVIVPPPYEMGRITFRGKR